MILVKLIILMTWEDMNMEMPNILITGRFVVLSRRNAFAVVAASYCNGNLLDSLVDFSKLIVWDGVKTFKMLVGDDKNMAGIVDPRFRGNEGSRKLILVNNVLLLVVVGFIAGQKIAKRADIIFGFMRNHAHNYSKVWFVLSLPENGIELFNRYGILGTMIKNAINRYENPWQG